MPQQRPKGPVKTLSQAMSQTAPKTADGGERRPYALYSRKTFTSASTVSLVFFDASGPITTTNIQSANIITSPQVFDIYHIGVDFEVAMAAAAAAGPWTEM